MKTQHTKGPWEINVIETGKNPMISVVTADTKIPVADLNWSREHDEIHPDKCEANARLIAAAPELLEVLIEISERAEKGLEPFSESWKIEFIRIRDKAREAIAKAIGNE